MQFLFPGVLYGLIAVSIPVIIHLINFRKYKKIYFTRTDLIADVQEQTRRRSNIRHWLILLLRMLAIVALVLAFANPYFKQSDTPQRTEKDYVSIYLDNSFSMQADRGTGDLLNEAVTRAMAIADAYESTTRFQFLTNEFKGKQQRWLTKEQLKSEIEETDFSPRFRKLSDVIDRQHQMFYQDRIPSGDIYQISDFQKNADDLEDNMLDSSMNYKFIPVRVPGVENAFIDSVWFTSPVLFVNQTAELNVRLVRHGDINSVPLKLFIDDKQRIALNAEFNGQKQKVFKIDLNIRNTGLHHCRFFVNDKSISYDNNFYFTFDVPESLKTLVLNDKETENKYLKAFFKGDSLVKAQFRNFQTIDYQSLSEYTSIILDGLPSISSGLQLALKEYVNSGKSLVIFPSPEADMESYNTLLSGFDNIKITGSSEEEKKVSTLAWESDFFRGIFETRPENPDYPEIFKNKIIDYGVASSAEVLINQSDENPFLLRTESGEGNVYLFSVACNEESSNFVTHSFFAVLYKMIFEGVASGSLYYIIGEPSVYRNDDVIVTQDKTPSLVKKNGDKEVIPALLSQKQGLQFVAGQYVNQNGFWNLNYQGNKKDALAYNFNMKESDTKLSDLDKLARENISVMERSPDALTSTIQLRREGKQVWSWFIIAALVFILFEVILLRKWKL